MASDAHKDLSKLGKRSPSPSVDLPPAKEQKTEAQILVDQGFPEAGSEEWKNPTKEQCICWLKNLVSFLLPGKSRTLLYVENELSELLEEKIPISPLEWDATVFNELDDYFFTKILNSKTVEKYIREPQKINSITKDVLQFSDGETRFIIFMKTQIKNCWNLWDKNRIFAPYFALVQSSGSGKTRTLKELIKYYPSVYIDFKKMDDFTQEFLRNITLVCKITNPEEAVKETQKIIFDLQEKAFNQLGDEQQKQIGLIVIDEASKLLEIPAEYDAEQSEYGRNAFVLLRKALSKIEKKKKLVMIIADTTSRLNNFTPSARKFHPHMRLNDFAGRELHPPIWNLPYDDIGKEAKLAVDNLSNPLHQDNISIANFRCFNYQIKLGRPLWFSSYITLKSESNDCDGEDNLFFKFWELVRYKLVGFSDKETKSQIPYFLPILGARLTLNVINANLAENLVSESLATITGISFERETVFCSYKSEPVVSEIATSIMNANLTNCLNTLSDSFIQTRIDVGSVGEIIAELILLRAFDLCVSSIDRFNYFENLENYPVSLKNFLDKLLSQEYFSLPLNFEGESKNVGDYLNNRISNLDDTGVFFSHFGTWSEDLSVDLFNRALERGCAIHCVKINFPGIDLVIPTYSISENKLNGCIWIQIKNQEKDKNWRDNSGVRMSPQSFLPTKVYEDFKSLPVSVGIYMGLRQQPPKNKFFIPISRYQSSTNLTSDFLQNNLINSLKSLQWTKTSNSKQLTEVFEKEKLQNITSASKVTHRALAKNITEKFLSSSTTSVNFWTIYTLGNHSKLVLDDFTKTYLANIASSTGLNVEKSSSKKSIIKLFNLQTNYTNLVVFRSHLNPSLFNEEQKNRLYSMLSFRSDNEPPSQLLNRNQSFIRFQSLNRQALSMIDNPQALSMIDNQQ